MSKQCGIWIDHRRALVVYLADGDAVTRTVESGVARRQRAGGSRTSAPDGPQDAFAEDRAQRKHEKALRTYYRSLANTLGTPDEMFVMGPGEAKGEFVKELDRTLQGRVVAVEPADKMTDPQVVAKVKAYFAARPEPA